MNPKGPGPWRRRLTWLLLAQGLWLPVLLGMPLGPWGFRQGSGRETGHDALPPLPADSGQRSRPPSLGELLAPAASQGLTPGRPEGQVPEAGRSGGVLLLNRPRAEASAAADRRASPEPGTAALPGQGAARQGASTVSRQSGATQDGSRVAAPQRSPSQLLGGSLGLEDLGSTGTAQPSAGSTPDPSPRGARTTSSHP